MTNNSTTSSDSQSKAGIEHLKCQYESECDGLAVYWARWTNTAVESGDTKVCESHANELQRSDEPVVFATLTAEEQLASTKTDHNCG